MYNGTIQSVGPRYCPIIEAKIVTFSEKIRNSYIWNLKGRILLNTISMVLVPHYL